PRGRIGLRPRDPYAHAKPKFPRLSVTRERVDAFPYATKVAAIARQSHTTHAANRTLRDDRLEQRRAAKRP
ncbi:hypothetical protein, partial [Burkholderia sp. BC1]|uniref:hypothetical protein n=1 Tax=Burkholderia sp. BC1 TaxID=1095370 RepID=UPI0040444B19